MKFGTSCEGSGEDYNCLSHWNMSAFHIAISHSINPNEMSAWMEVVQALTQYPVIDWFGLHGSMHMQRACFVKLIVGQSAALHLYNDHRLTGPTSYPHPDFGIAGQFIQALSTQNFLFSFLIRVASAVAHLIRCIAVKIESTEQLPTLSLRSLHTPTQSVGLRRPVVGLIGTKLLKCL